MKSKHCIIVSACKKYEPELCALLNSLCYVGNKQDVWVIGYQLSKEFTDQFSKLSYTANLYNIPEQEAREYGGEAEILCRKRYWYADFWGKEYEGATLVLDADMVFCRNPINYFEIAEKTGFVLGVSKEQNEKYNHPHHKAKGDWIIPEGTQPESDLCNCPLFLDTKIWGDALKKSWRIFADGFPIDNFKAPDMAAMNITLLEAGSANKTIVMPGLMWLGTNEQHLKPYIRVVMDRDLIKAECGIPIFSYHGQYYKAGWRKCQLDNRHNCAKHYLKTNLDAMAAGAMNLLYEYFKKMLDYKIVIEKRNYVHPELPYEE